MPFVKNLGIRARLVVLTAASVAPLMLLLAAGIAYSYGDALDRAKLDVRKTAEIAAARLSDTFQDARGRLDIIRNLVEVRRSSGPSCDAFMTSLQKANPQFVSLGLADRERGTICRGQLGGSYRLEDRSRIAEVLAMGPDGFAAGTYEEGIAAGMTTVLVVMPMAPVGGRATGVIFAAISLDHLMQSVRELSSGHDRSVVLLEASTGRVLVRRPNEVLFGTAMPDHPILPFLRTHRDGGVAELDDDDGTPRIFGAAPLPDTGSSGLTLLVGASRAATIAAVNLRSLIAVFLSLLVLGLVIAAISWLGTEMLVRPIRRLVQMASRIGAGEFEARTQIEGWQAPEFRELASTLDITAVRLEEGRRAEAAVAASESRYRLLAENTADMITCVSADGRRTFVSGASVELLGLRPEELLGEKAMDLSHPDDAEQIRSMAARLRAGGVRDALRYRVRHRDGRYVWIEATGRRIEGSDELVFAIRDASHRKAMEDHLEAANRRLATLAATDDLTGLPNRRTFNDRLANEIARCVRSGAPISLVLVDVDRFKAFNDGYGHQAGDVCLQNVATALGAEVGRAGDLVARYGGEEFVAVLPAATIDGARARAEAMRQRVRNLGIDHAGSEHGRVTISIGVASLSDAGIEDATSVLLRQADQALYAAKAGGRDAVVVFADAAPDLGIRQIA
ncbi:MULTISPECIES: diguanylate cyclase [unclassified Aureimonas]|uniref:sensor domain-containing diguanylate cyclase n=1 Tax=unclassified Aureimonas TaxID=2615206 RepID=UPI0006F441B5|nr:MULTISPECIES: diguanylate cyclase [unclassified Aureimonas]KQT55116.1 hypothetical protein ASG62_09670 [Aureimonas sp. Leaf427]KQT70905.1 hypothetical protein ASG54_20055 [Aureimonas sp. Leaf460]